MRKKCCTVRAVRQWHCCLESCGCSIPAVPKAMDGAVSSLSYGRCPCPWWDWGWVGFKGPSNPNHLVILSASPLQNAQSDRAQVEKAASLGLWG